MKQRKEKENKWGKKDLEGDTETDRNVKQSSPNSLSVVMSAKTDFLFILHWNYKFSHNVNIVQECISKNDKGQCIIKDNNI